MTQPDFWSAFFGRSDTISTMILYTNLVKQLLILPGHLDEFQSIRSRIEDVFKLAKDVFFLRNFHRYTTRFVKNAAYLNVLLFVLVISVWILLKDANSEAG